MALAGFAAGCGTRVLDPLLPMVAGDFGVTVAAAASLIAGFALAYGLGQVVTGPLGDRMGKTRIACFALFVYALTLAASSLAGDLATLVALRIGAGLASGAIIPLLMAYLGDTVPYAERQATIGRFLTGVVAAQLMAGPLSGIVGEVAGWRASFLVLGGLALLVAVVMAWRLGARVLLSARAGGGGDSGGARGGMLGGYAALLRRRPTRRLMTAAFFDGACLFGGTFPFVAAFLIEEFGLSAAKAGLVVAGFGIGSFVYTRIARRLVAAFGEGGLILWGGCGLVVTLAAIAVAPGWPVVAVVFAASGLLFFMFHGVLQARATEALPEARGTSVSAFAMSLFLGQSMGSLVFGTAIAFAGYRPAFALGAAAMLVLAIWTRAQVMRPGSGGMPRPQAAGG